MNTPRLKTTAQLETECRQWNEKYPVGQTVEFHPVIGNPKHRVTTTIGEAYVLSGHTAVVQLDKVPGCVALAACVPCEPRPKERLWYRCAMCSPNQSKDFEIETRDPRISEAYQLVHAHHLKESPNCPVSKMSRGTTVEIMLVRIIQ